MKRIVLPEILDSLSAGDPRAVRSRRDLLMINAFMQGQKWITNEVRHLVSDRSNIIEIGAGDGALSSHLSEEFPRVSVKALDLIKKPLSVSAKVDWYQGDLFEFSDYNEDSIVIANLFIHHFQDDAIEQLSEVLHSVKAVLFAEPNRAVLAQMMGGFLAPFVNDVTRHDMQVSIKAGFRKGELPHLFGDGFRWHEEYSVFGGLRVRGIRL